jgi:hypothetical protein
MAMMTFTVMGSAVGPMMVIVVVVVVVVMVVAATMTGVVMGVVMAMMIAPPTLMAAAPCAEFLARHFDFTGFAFASLL